MFSITHDIICNSAANKTAELSQRRPRDAPNIGYVCTEKFWESSLRVTTHPVTFPEICNGLLSDRYYRNARTKSEVRSFTRSWDNRVYSKNLGSLWIRPRSIFSQNFKRLLFGWTLWIYLPNLKFVVLSVPEIIEGTPKIWAVHGYAHTPFSPKILKGFCSDGPCEYTCQIWSS